MSLAELFILAVGLSMDAFAVSVCKGLATGKLKLKHYLAVGLWFGGFQALMPTVGYFLGTTFEKYITSFDHWIAFLLLALIGGNMIREALSGDEESADASIGFRIMLTMAVATSIDALAVGISFGVLPGVNLPAAVSVIGGNMIRESFEEDGEKEDDSFSFKTMLVLAIATSIDALAVGITFALLPDVSIAAAVSFIGVTTFILSAVGLKVGNIFGLKYKSKAELAGGVILILIGLKILLEHLGVISF